MRRRAAAQHGDQCRVATRRGRAGGAFEAHEGQQVGTAAAAALAGLGMVGASQRTTPELVVGGGHGSSRK